MSFKVICTNNTADPLGGDDAPELSVGSSYTVVDEITDPKTGNVLYELAEIPRFHFDRDYFSPISGISIEEIEEEYQEQEAAILDREFASIVHEYENADHA